MLKATTISHPAGTGSRSPVTGSVTTITDRAGIVSSKELPEASIVVWEGRTVSGAPKLLNASRSSAVSTSARPTPVTRVSNFIWQRISRLG